MSEALLDKIRKLLAKAEGTDNANEAEAFSAKAAQLIAEHRLDPSHVRGALEDGTLGLRRVVLGRGAYVRARLALLDAVARTNDCEVVFETGSQGTTAIVAGYEADLDVTEVLYTSLHAQAANQMAGVRARTAAATQRWRRSFLFGFATRVAELLENTRASAADRAGLRASRRRPHKAFPTSSPGRRACVRTRRRLRTCRDRPCRRSGAAFRLARWAPSRRHGGHRTDTCRRSTGTRTGW